MTRKSPYVLAALSIIVLLVVASTAGCTSSTTTSSSSSPQASGTGASVAPSGGQSVNTPGYPTDSSGFDPDPSVVPRYTPSVRTISMNFTDHDYAAFGYDTKDTLQQVSSFYQTAMPKLGYTSKVYSNTSTQFWVKYDKNGRTVVDLSVNVLRGDALSKFPNENYTQFGFRLPGPNWDGA